jgi:hypothetical protein
MIISSQRAYDEWQAAAFWATSTLDEILVSGGACLQHWITCGDAS